VVSLAWGGLRGAEAAYRLAVRRLQWAEVGQLVGGLAMFVAFSARLAWGPAWPEWGLAVGCLACAAGGLANIAARKGCRRAYEAWRRECRSASASRPRRGEGG
jgi:hypothetical protein